jgi:hypothetical protein
MGEDELQRRRRAAAYEHAAAVHDQAAAMHEDAAEFFDLHGQPGQAEHEHAVARRERPDAVADRARASKKKEAIEGE